MKTHIILLVALFVASGCWHRPAPPPVSPRPPLVEPANAIAPKPAPPKPVKKPLPPPAPTPPTPKESSNELPKKVQLDVVFASQAPFQNWSMPYQEACEEASVIMAAYYFKKKPLERQKLNQEIIDLVAWEVSEFGYYEDTTAEETARIARDYFGLDAQVTDDVSAERIERELAAGHLLIPPFAGRILPNPYFKQPGPLYHMLVITGYDRAKRQFITNDPGTNTKGEDFRYSYDALLNAVHDWNGGNVLQGKKVMIIVKGTIR